MNQLVVLSASFIIHLLQLIPVENFNCAALIILDSVVPREGSRL